MPAPALPVPAQPAPGLVPQPGGQPGAAIGTGTTPATSPGLGRVQPGFTNSFGSRFGGMTNGLSGFGTTNRLGVAGTNGVLGGTYGTNILGTMPPAVGGSGVFGTGRGTGAGASGRVGAAGSASPPR
ncbi:MAG TPA: hypothetical protein VG167_06830 [Verrucomicrobiae bacterium]|nr:hypothetical protein [Verrucomicrobiae bacterium]